MQQDMDQIFSKFRISSQEMLIINKSFTSGLKQQKDEVAELKEQTKLSSKLMQSLMEQAIAAE